MSWSLVVVILVASVAFTSGAVLAQAVPGGRCRPVSERKAEIGCWIIAHESLGRFTEPQVFWHLDAFATRDAADNAKGPHGTVVEAFGKVWLLTIENEGWRPGSGERVAEIGPLSIIAGAEYSAQYMEAVFTPGMTAPPHRHGGPEAWYTLAGETCLETPAGKQVGRAGGIPVRVPAGPPMHLTATGTTQRRALVLILHETSKPATTLAHDWQPRGLCRSN